MSTTIEGRKKQMRRLFERYCRQINDSSQWVLPYVWNIHYRAQNKQYEPFSSECEEFICHTNDIAFAAMLFTAWCLHEKQLHVTITGMWLSGFENEFTKIIS